MTATDKTREALETIVNGPQVPAHTSCGELLYIIRKIAKEALAGTPAQPTGEVVVTKNPAGAIVAVTRQDADGRVIEVIAEAAPSQQSAEVRAAQLDDMLLHPIPSAVIEAEEFLSTWFATNNITHWQLGRSMSRATDTKGKA